jgi:hypothetical protein
LDRLALDVTVTKHDDSSNSYCSTPLLFIIDDTFTILNTIVMRGCALVGLFDRFIAIGQMVQAVICLCFDSACASKAVVATAVVIGGAELSTGGRGINANATVWRSIIYRGLMAQRCCKGSQIAGLKPGSLTPVAFGSRPMGQRSGNGIGQEWKWYSQVELA